MKVLLFGGAGYIGTHVALEFIDRNDTVGIFDNLSSGLKSNVHPEALFYEGDIRDKARVLEVLSLGWDVVIHMAAFKAAGESMIKPIKYSENNIAGSLNLITGCIKAGVKRFILSSSAAVYGEPAYLPVDENHPKNPTNYYGYTKLCIEENLKWYAQLKEFEYVSLRYFNAAGYDEKGRMLGLENNPANLIPVVMEVAMGIRPNLLVFGNDYDTVDGTGVRDYVHVTDLAKGHVLAADYLLAGKGNLIVNLGSEEGLSVQQILDTARSITNKPIQAQYVDRRPGDPAKLVASSKMAYKTLGWKAEHSSAQTILETTWKVYEANQKRMKA
ncbi:UDP-glucose 4-epimerase GalE [Sphaerochaeta globosa]|jgi:UDP-glucose 4-epimerase|uniref:UDP-glucose 4-epimerase n=1 Tax=Sphaerochaeta globosa (strain ATCC BAA-1886 / DSM 22777 / Buddy) TaxID=158189 RepID=F0RWW9_SPHGB|nr:UDP-glucose 4-epimerase GalE [Sphaerochaeta globosa]ADY13750.1 UDP-glucose 4-epimerase [Sphaerochaeta globosa str. Buddy]